MEPEAHAAPRKVRDIVTRSGQRVRGYFPSWKSEGISQFESLVEEDVQRVFEVAPSVSRFKTQPQTLKLTVRGRSTWYTPDLRFARRDQTAFAEVKPLSALTRQETLQRLRTIYEGMVTAGLSWILVFDDDVRADGLQVELKLLLRRRPVPGKRHSGLHPHAWDPNGRCEPDAPTAASWRVAQERCDALVARFIGRDSEAMLWSASNSKE
jgi:hypothetical protein